MKIMKIDPFILHIPVTGNGIADSTHSITHWGVVGATITTDNGLTGWGFTGTHAFLPGDQLITSCIKDCLGPLLIGESFLEINRLWHKMARNPAMQWIGRAGIVQLAIAAIDTALWDLKAKHMELPLWGALGGVTSEVLQAYNTDIGWLSIADDKLVDGAKRVIEEEGFRGIKIKVGSSNPYIDIKRIEKVRLAIGDNIMFAIDGNGKWDLPTCVRFCRQAEAYNLFWFEEPMWYDDVRGHAELAAQTTIPIALGEQLYHSDAFQNFIDADAVHYVQPDITRLGGVSEFITVADAAHSRRLPVAAHAGEMGQVHVHLSFSHAACSIMEYIPWIKDSFLEPIVVKDGNYVKPQQPGAGTTPTPEALNKYMRPVK
ncbi:MAG: mandelate racemase/muconate lactonizing enzyme family protein [Bacteroidota bacterium]